MKKLLAFLLGIMVMTTMVAGCGGDYKKKEEPKKSAATEQKKEEAKPAAGGAQKFFNIATGGTSGTYFPIGGAVADVLNKNIPGANASAQSTGAAVANINLLQQGKVDIAFVQNDIAYYADKGTEMFKDKKVDGLQALACLYPETVQIVTLAGTDIKSVSDFKGKRVAVGAAGSGTEANARQILKAYGLTYDDVKVQYLSFGEASGALKDGNVDVAFVTAGFPTAAIQDIATQKVIRLIPVDGDKADALIKDYPFYTKVKIKANTYNKQDADVNAVAILCMLAVTNKMDEKTAYDVTKAIFTNLDRIKASHSAANVISKETALNGVSVPLAPGADKFFNEK